MKLLKLNRNSKTDILLKDFRGQIVKISVEFKIEIDRENLKWILYENSCLKYFVSGAIIKSDFSSDGIYTNHSWYEK